MTKLMVEIKEIGVKDGQVEFSIQTKTSKPGSENEKFLAEMIDGFVKNTELLLKLCFKEMLK